MADITVDEYHRVPDAASSPIPVYAVNTVAEQQPHQFDLASQTVNDQAVAITAGEPIGPAEGPIPDVYSDLELADSAMPGQGTVDDEPFPNTLLLRRSKLTMFGATVLLVAVLSLIVAPAVVLGVVMQQAMMGIALSGAVTTAIGIFAGFYYHHSKNG